jgi:ADP-ribose pyrophosphatase YjhB (NUDIX family)
MTTPAKMFVATKAFIVKDGKVLVVREASAYDVGTNAGKYDVVGGRIEPGEHYEDALHREIREEVGLEVDVVKPFAVNEWFPNVKGEQWHIVAIFFECRPTSDVITLGSDHDDYMWIDLSNIDEVQIMDNLRSVFATYRNRDAK